MKTAIEDQAAIVFSGSFYRAIGFGRSVQDAFDQGKVALLFKEIPEDKTPELLVRAGVVPSQIFLVEAGDFSQADIDYQAEFISQSFHRIKVLPNSLFTLKVVWKNIGKGPWPKRIRMGTLNPQDRISKFCLEGTWWILPNRIEFNTDTVLPGEIATFEIPMRAPSSLGTYRECFGLVFDGYRWFEECPTVCVDILIAEDNYTKLVN